ncbi:hypothetical protein F7725_011591 [Dissostichus mawsoni]|uniref:Uncharacterized protein n=1 Tax=Dissostichus mawsoni TaxID=36200 RepID=A0A7J5Z9W9_DISMA|nr:hypothetical protein F7725_011591 [Dissostichus mawsoni]
MLKTSRQLVSTSGVTSSTSPTPAESTSLSSLARIVTSSSGAATLSGFIHANTPSIQSLQYKGNPAARESSLVSKLSPPMNNLPSSDILKKLIKNGQVYAERAAGRMREEEEEGAQLY